MPFPLPSKLLRDALIESTHAVFVPLAVRRHHHRFVVRLVPSDGYIYILSVFDEIVAEDVRTDLGTAQQWPLPIGPGGTAGPLRSLSKEAAWQALLPLANYRGLIGKALRVGCIEGQ